MTADLLVLAGESSGDRIAAGVVAALGSKVRAYGIGGRASASAGVELVAQASAIAAMGVADVLVRAPAIAAAVAELVRRVREEPPRVALLVDYAELSARLGPWLRKRGVRVVWCVAPQVWAWRAGRTRALAAAMDRLAVILPFEVALWRAAGVDATFVGHPSLELTQTSRAKARHELSLGVDARAIAVLPGSRAGEVGRLAEPLARAARLLLDRGVAGHARIIESPNLEPRARAKLTRAGVESHIPIVRADAEGGAAPLLPAFDLALVASGTASLEAALAGAPPVVAFRSDALTFAVAKRLVKSPFVALPNVLLNRRAVPELLQADVSPESIAAAAEALLATECAESLAAELRTVLAPPDPRTFSERVAALVESVL